MSNSIAPGSSADVNVRVTALTTNPNVPVQYKTVILKKNLVNGVNTLTQEMMSAQNTKYVIKYDYVLGEDITVPTGCVLEFDGGSISASGSNDSITGANTGISGGLIKIFDTNITLAGTWNVLEAYPEWFGAKGDGITDDTNAIQKTINLCKLSVTSIGHGDMVGGIVIKFSPKIYLISSTIYINSSNLVIDGNNATFLTNFQSYGILFIAGNGLDWYRNGYTTALKYIDLHNFKIKSNTNYGTLAILFSGTRNSNISNVLIENAEIGVYVEDSSEFNFTNISCIGCGVSYILDGRYNRTALQTPLGEASGVNDCSSGVIVNPTSYYSQKNCMIACAVGNVEVSGGTFGMFSERSEDGDCTLNYELGNFAGKSIIVMPNQTNNGFVRSFKLNNCVFEANPSKKTTCVYIYNTKLGTCIDNVVLSDLYLQTYKAMNNSDDIYTTFIATNVIGYNNRINVDTCVIRSADNGYLYPCFYEEINEPASVTFNNCFPKVAFSRGLKRNLYDDMIIKDSKYPNEFTAGTLFNGQGPMIRTYNNEVEIISYKARNWNSGCIGIKLDYEGSNEDLDFYVVVNDAPDTNSSVYNVTNIARYSNSVLPFEINNVRRTALIIFNPFDANYTFTHINIVFGSKTSNDIKVYGLEVGCYKIPYNSEKYNPF